MATQETRRIHTIYHPQMGAWTAQTYKKGGAIDKLAIGNQDSECPELEAIARLFEQNPEMGITDNWQWKGGRG